MRGIVIGLVLLFAAVLYVPSVASVSQAPQIEDEVALFGANAQSRRQFRRSARQGNGVFWRAKMRRSYGLGWRGGQRAGGWCG